MNSTTTHPTIRSLLGTAARRLQVLHQNRKIKVNRVDQQLDHVSVRFQNQPLQILVRHGTTDIDLVHMMLGQAAMYRLPQTVQPKVIFDIGANIGVTAVYFSLLYPQAKIYCFEPLPENLELLRRNTQSMAQRIRILPYGLSDRNGSFDYFMSDNAHSFGGGGFMQIGHDPSRQRSLPLKTVTDALDELDLNRVDLFKIDTEGSELAILRSIPREIRLSAQAFVGELHGVGNWEVCHTLAPSHAVGIDKRFDARCFPFIAVRNDLARAQAVTKRAA